MALWQAEHVRDLLGRTGQEATLVKITTTGDRILDRRLETVGGKGAFLKEIEEALLAHEVDLAVHSLKDVPAALPGGLRLCAYLERADPRDALLSRSGLSLEQLPAHARIGTTSLRRQAQIRWLRPDLELEDLRGNVDTRLRRLSEGRFDAILLALAGLRRLGLEGEVTQALDPDIVLPAPGQGAITLECRAGDAAVEAAVAAFNHPPTAAAVTAERVLLAELGGGCNVPLAAYAAPDAEGLRLRALVARPDGSALLRAEARGIDPERLGHQVAQDLANQGAAALLGR